MEDQVRRFKKQILLFVLYIDQSYNSDLIILANDTYMLTYANIY